jgi:hypothetical protein
MFHEAKWEGQLLPDFKTAGPINRVKYGVLLYAE